MFTLYKIYFGDELAYLGRTRQPLKRRLHGHFFKARLHKAIDIFKVTRIESAEFATCADMYLYEIYYINKLHPLLNRDDVAPDELTVTLPEVAFAPFECDLMDKWKVEVIAREEALRQKRREQREKRAKRKQQG
ncbi:hypothetical protein LJC60_04480 [Ruminococcaceae bacterium OttesenSCG-928-D13]|nr:hypothetical protein [Ruminococcaceae bacterium OttesenSCG-928-D13]